MKGVISKISEDGKVEITLPEGQVLIVSKDELPANIQVGLTIYLYFSTDGENGQVIKTDPKELLNELLNPKEG